MKNKFIILIAIILILVGFIILNGKYITLYAEWKLNWEFSVPKPNEIKTVFNTREGFPNEGQTYYIFEYSERKINKMKKQDFWLPITAKSYETVSVVINNFHGDVKSVNNDPEKNYQKIFQEYPVEFTNNDKYYKLTDGNSYLIAILNTDTQKLFVMEWIE